MRAWMQHNARTNGILSCAQPGYVVAAYKAQQGHTFRVNTMCCGTRLMNIAQRKYGNLQKTFHNLILTSFYS
jgi:hypothetical protein